MSQSKILSYDQYAEIEKRGYPLPYIVVVRQGNQRALLYGAEHTNDPQHPQFADLEKRWRAFIDTTSRPIALMEGHFDEVSTRETENREQSIVAGGEAQFMVYLARHNNVPVQSPEPERKWEADKLAQEFGRDKVVLYYFVRQLGWWNRFTKKPDIEQEANSMLRLMHDTYKWEDVDFSQDSMDKLHKVLFSKPLPLYDRQWLYDITTPTSQDYVTNVLARRSGELRDDYILEQIQNYWEEGYSPFAVFGAAHAIRLEPAIRAFGNE